MGQPNNSLSSYEKQVSFITWKKIEADNSKFSQDLREIQKTVQDYGPRLIHIPVKIENLNQKL